MDRTSRDYLQLVRLTKCLKESFFNCHMGQ
jgi:hypothetical protein